LKSFSLNSRKETWSETWEGPESAKTVVEEKSLESRKEAISSDDLTSSTSYLILASSGDTGSPDQITSSGSMGGMKRVDLWEAMSYV